MLLLMRFQGRVVRLQELVAGCGAPCARSGDGFRSALPHNLILDNEGRE